MRSIRLLFIRALSLSVIFFSLSTSGMAFAVTAATDGNGGGTTTTTGSSGTTTTPSATTVSGQSAISPEGLPTNNLGHNEIQKIMQLAFGAIGALSLLMIVVSGFRYVVSDGDPQKMTGAKDGIIYALVGLAVAIAAESIVAFVAGNI